MRVEAKICGLVRPGDARAAESAGADYLGVVFAPGPRQRDPSQAREIWNGTAARRVGVFVDPELDEVLRVARDLGLAVVQLHGSEAPALCREVRDSGPWAVWKAVAVRAGESLRSELERYAGAADGVLLEGSSTAGRGGVGARFDWSRLESVRAAWPDGLRLILAGGLSAANVEEAIRAVRPHVVDVSSGVESVPGRKDPARVQAFLSAVRRMSG